MSDRPRVLITGCHGRLGQHLLRRFLGWANVLGVSRQASSFVRHPRFRHAHVRDARERALSALFLDFEPEIVVNAAAYTQVDRAETERDACWSINVGLVETLASLCERHGAWLAQMSSDYVFGGESGPYDTEDPTGALGWYGETKLRAEELVLERPVRAAILRTMVLFGRARERGPDFVEWVVAGLSAGQRLSVVTDQIGNGAWALDVAGAVEAASAQRLRGVFHAASPELVSRFDLARLVAEVHGLDRGLLEPTTTAALGQKARRPLASGLRVASTEARLGYGFLPLRQALEAHRVDASKGKAAPGAWTSPRPPGERSSVSRAS
jgi:dTDP-4-dehydrorhamnose reductase